MERQYFAYTLALSVLLSGTAHVEAQAGPLNMLKRAAARAGVGKDAPSAQNVSPKGTSAAATTAPADTTASPPANETTPAPAATSPSASTSSSTAAASQSPAAQKPPSTQSSSPGSSKAPGSAAQPAATQSPVGAQPAAPNPPPAKNAAARQPSRAQSTPNAAHPAPVRDKWAVLIGVNKFQDSTLAPVRFAPNNVSTLNLLFQDSNIGKFAPDHVTQLANPTKEQIKQTLSDQWLLKKALPNDMIVLYINSRATVDPTNNEVYIFAADTPAKDAATSGIPLKETLSELKQRTQSRHIVALLDLSPSIQPPASTDNEKSEKPKEASSESASVAAKSAEPSLYERIAADTSTSILAASKLTEPSNENSINKTSYFVQYIADGLRAGAGMLPFAAIAQHVFESVPADVQSQLKRIQTPQLAIPVVNKHIIEIALGMPTKSSVAPKKISIGHPVDQLPHQRPDLVRGSRPAVKIAPSKPNPEPDQDDGSDVMGDVDFGPYMTKMKKDIQAKWKPPKGFEDRRVVAVFTIMRDGKIIDPTIVDGSGMKDVDDSAMAALQAASPLEPLPKGSPHYVQMRYQFDWHVKRD